MLMLLSASISSEKICRHTSYVTDVHTKFHGVMSTPSGPKKIIMIMQKNTNFGNLKHVEQFSMLFSALNSMVHIKIDFKHF